MSVKIQVYFVDALIFKFSGLKLAIKIPFSKYRDNKSFYPLEIFFKFD